MNAIDREMEEPKQPLTEEELRNRAYLAALRLKAPGFDEKIIYTGLENERIPEALARQIAKEVIAERKKEYVKQARPVYKFYFD